MAIILPDLPYAYDALEPYIDAETMLRLKNTLKLVRTLKRFWLM